MMNDVSDEWPHLILEKAGDDGTAANFENLREKMAGHRGALVVEPRRERRYLPTLSDLCDRLSIVLMKEIFIKGHREDYRAEQKAIMHDIDLILAERPPIGADQLRALFVLQLANRFIWERESTIRDDSTKESAEVQLGHLRATHSVNGVRNTAKNAIAAFDGGRVDYKVDALAAELPPEHGNWRVFEE